MMNAAAPKGMPPGGSVTKNHSLPAAPRRGPEAEVHRIEAIFMVPVRRYEFRSVSTPPRFFKPDKQALKNLSTGNF